MNEISLLQYSMYANVGFENSSTTYEAAHDVNVDYTIYYNH